MLANCPLDLICNHPFGPPPNGADFAAAESKPVRVWIEEAFMALKLSNPDTIDEYRAFMVCSGVERLATYLVNLCDNTQLMNECPAAVLGRPGNYVGIWLWYVRSPGSSHSELIPHKYHSAATQHRNLVTM